MNEYQKEKASYIKRFGKKAWQQYQKNKRLRKVNKNPLRQLLLDARKRAKVKNIEFTIPINTTTLTIPETCPVLNIPLRRAEGTLGGSANSPSIDRIDNNRGYTEDNVRIISKRANSLKSDGTLDELERVVQYIKNNIVSVPRKN